MHEPIQRTVLGSRGEDLALKWFLGSRPGSRLLARNFRCKQGEIDLIFWEEPLAQLVFVEVRYRTERAWVGALASITWTKRQRLRRAIEVFLAREGARFARARGLRLDVLALDARGGAAPVISHFENIELACGPVDRCPST